MSEIDSPPTGRFTYSVVRVVPDPIKNEGINVGVVVASDVGRGRLKWNPRFTTRVRALQRDFSFDAVDQAIRGLEKLLHVDPDVLTLWDTRQVRADEALLTSLALRLNNQLQLTEPRRYRARTVEEAAESLFRRFVLRHP